MASLAEETARREITRAALVKLTTGESLSQRLLFEHPDFPTKDKYERWKYEVVGRLRELGVLEVVSTHPKHPEYRLVKGKSTMVDRFLDDETELTRLIWPTAAPVQEDEDAAGPSDPQLTLVPVDKPTAAHDGVGDDEFKALVVKYLGALVENTIYIREKLDRLEKTITETHSNSKKLADELG